MKAQILKHTGLSEKEFYAKYKTPDDFFNSKEGKAFKKAQMGLALPQLPDIQAMAGPLPGPQASNYPAVGGGKPFSSPNPQVVTDMGDTDRNGIPDFLEPDTASVHTTFGPKNSPYPTPKGPEALSKLNPYNVAGLVGDITNTVDAFKEEKKEKDRTKIWKDVTGLQLTASKTKPEKAERKYDRPEVISSNTLFPSYGVGTNPIAQDGSMIGGNPGEIQNTFDPYDIYDDMGYEPLNDSLIKQYQTGGDIAGALSGPTTGIMSSLYDNNAGFQAGNTVGKFAQFIPGVGPIISAAASPILGAIGGQLDRTFGNAGKIKKNQAAIDRNINAMSLGNQSSAVQAGYASYLQNGGFTPSHGNPQVITHYGKYSMKELLKPDPMMNTLQDGGNMGGGEIVSHWGGDVKPVSYNPYMDGSGYTYNGYGQSHRESDGQGRTGIGISVRQAGGEINSEPDVEIEKNEPVARIGEDTVVFGDVPIGKQGAMLLGDPKAKDKRFKNYIADLNKQENKHTEALANNTKNLKKPNLEPLELKTYELIDLGNNMNLKNIANKKKNAANLQNAINDTRDEFSDYFGKTISAPALGKGKFEWDHDAVTRNAKHGGSLRKLEEGGKTRKFKSRKEAEDAGFIYDTKTKTYRKSKGVATKTTTEKKAANALGYVPKGQKKQSSGVWGKVTPEQVEQLKVNNPWYDWSNFDPKRKNDVLKFQQEFNNKAIEIGSPARIFQDDALGEQTITAKLDTGAVDTTTPAGEEIAAVEADETGEVEDNNNWWNLMGAALPYLRPSNARGLDTNQLVGELHALSNNQVQPVSAQSYQPQLQVPYDISLQDQLNQVTKQTRAAQRMAGYNPAAQAAIAAQSYAPANQILGEQFRLNQAEKDKVYSGNIDTLNKAREVNLGLYDQQAQRQAQAKSNTDAITQAALNSISSKYQQNSLENKQLQTYENMYNYRFGPNMRAINMNAPFNPNLPTVYRGEDSEPLDYSDFVEYTKAKKAAKAKKEEPAKTRNGSIVSALKRM